MTYKHYNSYIFLSIAIACTSIVDFIFLVSVEVSTTESQVSITFSHTFEKNRQAEKLGVGSL